MVRCSIPTQIAILIQEAVPFLSNFLWFHCYITWKRGRSATNLVNRLWLSHLLLRLWRGIAINAAGLVAPLNRSIVLEWRSDYWRCSGGLSYMVRRNSSNVCLLIHLRPFIQVCRFRTAISVVFTTQHMLWYGVRLSVRLKQMFCRNDWTVRPDFRSTDGSLGVVF